MKIRGIHGESQVEDPVLLGRIAKGDLSALGLLYDRYAHEILRFASRAVRSDDAEDVVHTTFLRVVQKAAVFDPTVKSARPWLFAIAARVASERRRSLRRWLAALNLLAAEPRATSFAISEMRPDLERDLSRLSPAKRVTLILSEVAGFTCEEIAEMLSVPVGTIWTRLHHARREMRRFRDKADS